MRLLSLLSTLLPDGLPCPSQNAPAGADSGRGSVQCTLQPSALLHIPNVQLAKLLGSLNPPISTDVDLAFCETNWLAEGVTSIVAAARASAAAPAVAKAEGATLKAGSISPEVKMESDAPPSDSFVPLDQVDLGRLVSALLDLRDNTITLLSAPPSHGAELLLEERTVGQEIEDRAILPAISGIPKALQILRNPSGTMGPALDGSRQALGFPGQVVQLAGPRGIGKRTMLLNSLLHTLYSDPSARALWLIVQPESQAGLERKRQDRAARIAQRSAAIWQVIDRQRRGDESAGEAELPALTQANVEAGSPLERLSLNSSSSTDGLLALLDDHIAILASSTIEQDEPTSPHTRADPPATLAVVVIDSLETLFAPVFASSQREANASGMAATSSYASQSYSATPTAAYAALTELVHSLRSRCKAQGMCAYLLNSAVSSVPTNESSSFEKTSLRPALGPTLQHQLDASLWLTSAEEMLAHAAADEASDQSGRARGRTLLLETLSASDSAPGAWAPVGTNGLIVWDVL